MWVITAIATISTVSGVGMGIRRLSEVCFTVGLFLMTMVFFLDRTTFILNLIVQSIGFSLHKMVQIDWHTDAFEQLGESSGRRERNRFVAEGYDSRDGPEQWMQSWTIFYWGWWISWCPFVGVLRKLFSEFNHLFSPKMLDYVICSFYRHVYCQNFKR